MCTLDFCTSLPLSFGALLKQRISEKQLMGAVLEAPKNGMQKSQNTEKVVFISNTCVDSRVNGEMQKILPIP